MLKCIDRCGQLDKSNCEGGSQRRYWQIVTTVATVTEEVETVPSVTSIRSVDSRAHNSRPVGSDKYLVFNLHQHPSHTAHVQ